MSKWTDSVLIDVLLTLAWGAASLGVLILGVRTIQVLL